MGESLVLAWSTSMLLLLTLPSLVLLFRVNALWISMDIVFFAKAINNNIYSVQRSQVLSLPFAVWNVYVDFEYYNLRTTESKSKGTLYGQHHNGIIDKENKNIFIRQRFAILCALSNPMLLRFQSLGIPDWVNGIPIVRILHRFFL